MYIAMLVYKRHYYGEHKNKTKVSSINWNAPIEIWIPLIKRIKRYLKNKSILASSQRGWRDISMDKFYNIHKELWKRNTKGTLI